MQKEIISTSKAPSAIGPYSQGIKIGEMVFTSGQIPVNPATGEVVTEVNEVYGEYFNENPPARSCVEVARLPKDCVIEIEAVATV